MSHVIPTNGETRIKQGKMALSSGDLPDLGCLLVQLNDESCCGRALLQYLPPKMAESWMALLKPGLKVGMLIDVPPPGSRIETGATVLEVRGFETQMEIVLIFKREKPPAVNQSPVDLNRTLVKPHGVLYRNQKLGSVLTRMGHLTMEEAEDAVRISHGRRERLGRYLTRSGKLSSEVICRAISLQSGIPMTDLANEEIDSASDKVFPLDVMLRHTFVTFDTSRFLVCIAVADPPEPATVAELARLCGKRIEVFLALEDLIANHLDTLKASQKKEPRKFIRYDYVVPAQYQFCGRLGTPAEALRHNGATRNVSEDGFLIEGSPAEFGSPDDLRRRGICVSVHIAVVEFELRALCQLRFIKERDDPANPAAKRWLMGLKIIEMTSEDRRHLKELCFEALKAAQQS